MRITALFVSLATAVGCAPTRTTSYDAPGSACLVGDPEDIAFGDTTGLTSLEVDEPATVVVVISECSSGSTDWLEKTCSAELSGSTLAIAAFAKSRTPNAVTADCQFITVECTTPPLPAGELTLTYGGTSATLDVPSDGPMACVTP